jgi:hypothetical protein
MEIVEVILLVYVTGNTQFYYEIYFSQPNMSTNILHDKL